MKTRIILIVLALAAMLALSVGLSMAQGPHPTLPTGASGGGPQAAVGSAFTYQGHLKKGGSPVNATCDMAFRLYDDATGGNLHGTITTTVPVESGLFTVALDFGPYAFYGSARWLEIAVQCPGDAGFNTLTPRQALTATPYALSLRPGAEIIEAVGSSAILYARNTATSTVSGGVVGMSDSTLGYGVKGYATAGSGETYGVYGRSDSTQGMGVFGRAAATTGYAYGVYGRSDSTQGSGVRGVATAGGGYVSGVFGETASTDGYGVYGLATATSGNAVGVAARSTSTDGYGVWAWASATTGTTYGVYGRASSPNGTGVYGWAMATSGTNYGVYGRSNSTNGRGVYGESDDVGVYGYSDAAGSVGVLGFTGPGSGQSYGVYGQTNSDNGWAAYFGTSTGNGVYVSTPLGHTGLVVQYGTKNAAVDTDQGVRLLYTEESAEVWFADYGFGRLQNGRATIVIDPLFAQTVNLKEPYHVFIQVYGEAQVYVSRRTPTSFEVRLWDGDPNVEFSYRLVAKRLGYEDTRLAPFPAGDDNPIFHPDRAPAEP